MKALHYLIFILFCAILVFSVSYSRQNAPDNTPKDTPARQKVIMLGVDGFSEKVITELLQQKRLRNIQVLRKSGSYGRITSINPIFSPSIWTSIATGKKREDHGIVHFQIKDEKGRMMVTNNSHRKTKTLWNILSDHQMRSGLLGFFNTWPVEKINGFMISDLSIYPIENGCYPTQIEEVMKDVLAPYINYDSNRLNEFSQMPFEEEVKYFTPNMFKLLDQIGSQLINNYMEIKNKRIYSENEPEQYRDFFQNNELIEQVVFAYFVDLIRFEYAKRLYNKNLDFFFLYLRGADIISHTSWQYYKPAPGTTGADIESYKDIIPNYYDFVDRVLGYFLEKADQNTTLILISDHGFKKKRALFFKINKILNILGYLDYGPDGEVKRDKIFDDRFKWERFVKFRRLHVYLSNLYPGRNTSQDEAKMKQIVDQLSAIRVGNLKLFEKINYYPGKHNSLSPLRKRKLYKNANENPQLASGLYSIEAFVNGIFFSPDIQDDPQFMDRTITIKGRSYPLKDCFEHVHIGWHSLNDGIVYFLGPSIKPNYLIKGFSVLDVTPAILNILDMPIGADMAGGVPIGIFKPEFLIQHPIYFIKSYDEINQPLAKTTPQKSPVEHKTKDQLRALGYIQ